MRLSSAVLVTAALLRACSASAADPCAPPPLLPLHASAFALGSSAVDDATPSAPSSIGLAPDELSVQANCLVWEARVAPKAELLQPLPVRPAGSPGFPPLSPQSPALALPAPPRITVSRVPVGPPSLNPFKPAEGSPSFRLGLTLPPSP